MSNIYKEISKVFTKDGKENFSLYGNIDAIIDTITKIVDGKDKVFYVFIIEAGSMQILVKPNLTYEQAHKYVKKANNIVKKYKSKNKGEESYYDYKNNYSKVKAELQNM